MNKTNTFLRQPLLAEEADQLSHACQTLEEKLIVWVLVDTGLRISELCSLTPQNMLWQEKALRFSGKGGPFGKMSKIRVVPLSPRAFRLLSSYFAGNNKWFVKARRAQQIVRIIANRAQIATTVSPHVLRHTFATLALQRGISLPAVQKAMGHDKLATTAIYLRYTDRHVLEEFEKKW